MRRSVVARVAPLVGGAAVLAGCSAPPLPEITFFADGDTVRAEPLQYCDALLTSCESNPGTPATLEVRPGEPVQVSVPSDVAETPWLINIQSRGPEGRVLPVRREVFTDNGQHAYTAVPKSPRHQLLVVEIQQLGAARAADEQGKPIVDEQGRPQLITRARSVWSLRIEPAKSH